MDGSAKSSLSPWMVNDRSGLRWRRQRKGGGGRGFDIHALPARVEPPITGLASLVFCLVFGTATDILGRFNLLNIPVKVFGTAIDIQDRFTLLNTPVKVFGTTIDIHGHFNLLNTLVQMFGTAIDILGHFNLLNTPVKVFAWYCHRHCCLTHLSPLVKVGMSI